MYRTIQQISCGIYHQDKMALLFEYGKWKSIKNNNALRQMLKDIWGNRLLTNVYYEQNEEEEKKRNQQFLSFDGNLIRARNYVGFVQNGDEIIEIYPKVFRHHLPNPSADDKMLMLRHIFYWFGYCRKWSFPFSKVSLDTLDINEFPELIINLIANQFLKTVSEQPLSMYQEVEEALTTPRGSINFKRYINDSLSHGNFHHIECDHEPFLFDNKVNRVIKYCARLLMMQTKFAENFRVLQEIVFILDEVEDTYCTVHDIETISLNAFFADYVDVLDSCRLILSQQLYSSNTYDLSQWSLLFPMEYIFENFLAGFLENKFSKEWKVEYQKSNKYLSDDPEAFNMKHDIFLTTRNGSNRKVIVDTKYILRKNNFKDDDNRGIKNSDVYQMLSYAFKRGCSDVLLVYPNITDDINKPDKFKIISGFGGADEITVTAMEIPFSSLTNFDNLDSMLHDTLQTQLSKFLL